MHHFCVIFKKSPGGGLPDPNLWEGSTPPIPTPPVPPSVKFLDPALRLTYGRSVDLPRTWLNPYTAVVNIYTACNVEKASWINIWRWINWLSKQWTRFIEIQIRLFYKRNTLCEICDHAVRPKKNNGLFLRHFFWKTNEGGRNIFYCSRFCYSKVLLCFIMLYIFELSMNNKAGFDCLNSI